MARRRLIAGNWKMNGLVAQGLTLVRDLVVRARGEAAPCDVLICPPATLARAAVETAGGLVSVGGKDCHPAPSGAHTGDISAVMLRDARKHRSVNAGWPEGAMAGALDLLLAGPREYQGEVVRDAWIGDGKARATHVDIRRALYVFWVACLIDGLVVAALTVVRFS